MFEQENGPGAVGTATEAKGDRNTIILGPTAASGNQSTTLDAAYYYNRRGWSLVEISTESKQPREQGWDHHHLGFDDLRYCFASGGNIGVKLGADSGWLVDVDLDCAEALALADLYLQPTGAIFGRASRPRSHRLYIAPGATYQVFADPLATEPGPLCFGKTPMQTFLDALPLAREKLMAA
jgi:hypothetical protein